MLKELISETTRLLVRIEHISPGNQSTDSCLYCTGSKVLQDYIFVNVSPAINERSGEHSWRDPERSRFAAGGHS